MRAFLDRLLFALPAPPPRSTVIRGGLYALFGLVLYALFLGVLYAQAFCLNGLRQACERVPGMQISMSQPELAFFPPSLTIAQVTVLPDSTDVPLTLRSVYARPTLFPLGLILTAESAGGSFQLSAAPSALWNPEQVTLRLNVSDIAIHAMLAPFIGTSALFQMTSGKLNGTAHLDLPIRNGKPDPFAGEGTLQFTLRGASAQVSLPILTTNRLEQLTGTLEAGWKQDHLTLHQIELKSPDLACTVQGQISLVPQDLPASRLDVQSVLRLSLGLLKENLMPERTLRSLKDNGEVRARIRDTFRRPSFDIQS